MTILNPAKTFADYKTPFLTGVPDELKGYRQWIVWKLEQKPAVEGKKQPKPTKVPYSPITHRRSGSNETYRETWGSFEDACQAYATGKFSGISLAITESDPFVVIDFDHCINEGQIEDWVEKWIDKLDSYAEISPSGTGIHIIMRGKKPGSKCKKVQPDYEIEMYEKVRFLTITGHVVDEKHFLSQEQDALTELYNERIDIDPKPVAQPASSAPAEPLEMDDHTLLAKIRGSKQAPKFDRLMAGDTSGYANADNEGHSEADMALCCMLAWWTNKDPERIDRLFRTSQLLRPKWDESRGDAGTYGQMTIREAINKTEGGYQPNQRKSNVVPIKNTKDRKVQNLDTGFDQNKTLFPEPYPWPDTGSHHYIDCHTGALYRGQEWSDARDLIALRPIWLHSIAKDEFNEKYRVIRFYDEDFQQQTACFPAQWFTKNKDGNVWSTLMAQGMILMSGKEKYVSRYLDTLHSVCSERSWAASKLGWFETLDEAGEQTQPVFVLPDKILGSTGDKREVFFQSAHEVNSKAISPRGKLGQWKTNVADKAKGNQLIMFAIMASLAGGMTKLSKTSSGGFHFWGLSSYGKTALIQCAASVWGDASDPQTNSQRTSIRKWNATANGLEATAQLHNDIVLCLDEIGELEPSDLSKLIYTLTGGTPKGRSQDKGGLKNQAYWHIMLLSSGENSTEHILKSIGQSKRGGQTHRLPDVRVDALPNGIVQVDTPDPAEFVDELKKACSQNYGVAGPVFITWLLNQMETKGRDSFFIEMNQLIKSMEQKLVDGINPLPNEIRRVLKRMAAIAVAGYYAAEAGVLDWVPESINDCLIFVRNLWLSDMEGQVSELDRALADLRGNLLANLANFEDLYDSYARTPVKMMGYKDHSDIMVLPKTMDELCSSYSKRQLLEELDKKKFLSLGEFDKSKGKVRIAKKIPLREGKAKERPRCYWISREFLED